VPRQTFRYDGKRYDIRANSEYELGAKVKQKMTELEEGKTLISKNMSVESWFDEFMKTYKAKSISPETYDDYYSRFNSKIKPVIGKMKLKDVREIHCQKVINKMEGSSKTYIGKVSYTMDQMFRRAKKNHLMLDNPAADLEPVEGAEDGERRPITDIERKYTYIVAEYHRAGLWIKTILLAGLRPSETAALQGRHLEFDKNRIKIEGSVKKKDKRIGSTKTKAGERYAPMPLELKEQFAALNLGPFDFVFTNTLGGRLSKTNMRIMWNNFKKEMNVAMGCKVVRNQVLPLNYEAVKRNGMEPIFPVADDLVPYCYRHTFSTDMRSAGISLDDMAEVMGHEDTEVTKGYTHESEEAFNRAAKKIAKYQKQVNPLKSETSTKPKAVAK
jgi:integrase